MPENNEQINPVRDKIYTDTHDKIPQPKGEFENPFTAMRERKAKAERKAESALPHQQNQTN